MLKIWWYEIIYTLVFSFHRHLESKIRMIFPWLFYPHIKLIRTSKNLITQNMCIIEIYSYKSYRSIQKIGYLFRIVLKKWSDIWKASYKELRVWAYFRNNMLLMRLRYEQTGMWTHTHYKQMSQLSKRNSNWLDHSFIQTFSHKI